MLGNFSMEMPNSPGILHGDAKFSREFCIGIPNSLGNFAWGCQIPCLVGIPKTLRGFQNPREFLTGECHILGGAGSPMTPDHFKSPSYNAVITNITLASLQPARVNTLWLIGFAVMNYTLL